MAVNLIVHRLYVKWLQCGGEVATRAVLDVMRSAQR